MVSAILWVFNIIFSIVQFTLNLAGVILLLIAFVILIDAILQR